MNRKNEVRLLIGDVGCDVAGVNAKLLDRDGIQGSKSVDGDLVVGTQQNCAHGTRSLEVSSTIGINWRSWMMNARVAADNAE